MANAAVTTLVGSRIFPQVIDQNEKTRPAVVLTVVSEVPYNTLSSPASTRLFKTRIQVDIYAKTYKAARATHKAIDAVLADLADHDMSAYGEDVQDGYDDETQEHSVSADYFVSL